MSGYSRDELADILVATAELLREVAPHHALIGGAAVMVYGERARTRDVDFLVAFGDSEREELIARAEARGMRVERKAPWHLRLWRADHYADIVTAEVDLQLSAVRTARELTLHLGEVRIVDVEHLVALKVLAGRPRDKQDVENILELHPELDRERVQALLAPWGLALPPTPSR